MLRSRTQRGNVSIPVPLILLVIAGVGVWFFFLREKPPEVVDPHAGIKTTAIDSRLADFQRAWNDNDTDAVREFFVVDEDPDPEDTPPFEGALKSQGWGSNGLPKIMQAAAQQTQKVRYTMKYTLEGYAEQMTAWWEWSEDKWLIATLRPPAE